MARELALRNGLLDFDGLGLRNLGRLGFGLDGLDGCLRLGFGGELRLFRRLLRLLALARRRLDLGGLGFRFRGLVGLRGGGLGRNGLRLDFGGRFNCDFWRLCVHTNSYWFSVVFVRACVL